MSKTDELFDAILSRFQDCVKVNMSKTPFPVVAVAEEFQDCVKVKVFCLRFKKKNPQFLQEIRELYALFPLYLENDRSLIFGQGGFEPPTPWSRTKCASLCATIRKQQRVYLKECYLSIKQNKKGVILLKTPIFFRQIENTYAVASHL